MFNGADTENILSIRKCNLSQKRCLLDNTVCALCRHQNDIELA